MKILINASNLHVGGGVQVATSFIHELSLMKFFEHEFHVIVSEVVDGNLNKIDCVVDGFASYRVLNSHGILSAIKFFRIKVRDYDAIYTIFGPFYSFIRPRRNVVGFAQPWIIYPENELYNEMPFFIKLKSKFKYAMQRIFFSKSDILFVELEHVRKKLIDLKVIKSDKIIVVYNCLSSVYTKFQNCPLIPRSVNFNDLKLGFLGRNYPHKNLNILPDISKFLYIKYKIKVKFYVTFTEFEWNSCSDAFKDCSVNFGPLTVDECPRFYLSIDGVIFPSLLECFSATPLEALAMGCPLFASDREFNRDICKNYANYFDPMNPQAAAELIAEYYKSLDCKVDYLVDARSHAFKMSSPAARAASYVACLTAC